jgi:hypothetical protein
VPAEDFDLAPAVMRSIAGRPTPAGARPRLKPTVAA